MKTEQEDLILKIAEVIDTKNHILFERNKQIQMLIQKFLEIANASAKFKLEYRKLVDEKNFPKLSFNLDFTQSPNWSSDLLQYNGCELSHHSLKINGVPALDVPENIFNQHFSALQSYLDAYIIKIQDIILQKWDEILQDIYIQEKKALDKLT